MKDRLAARLRPPIQPAPGEYAIAALERAKQCLARTGFVAALAARSDDLVREALTEELP